jgi:hypothetical protein
VVKKAKSLYHVIVSHSIINRLRKPAWVEGLGATDFGRYRRFYRQPRKAFAGAGDGVIFEAITPATPSSIEANDTSSLTLPAKNVSVTESM